MLPRCMRRSRRQSAGIAMSSCQIAVIQLGRIERVFEIVPSSPFVGARLGCSPGSGNKFDRGARCLSDCPSWCCVRLSHGGGGADKRDRNRRDDPQ